MKVVVMVVSVEAIPVGVLIDGVVAGPMCRRSRFWLRCAGGVIVISLPALIAILAPLGEQTAGPLLLLGLPRGLLLIAGSRFVLFHGARAPRPRRPTRERERAPVTPGWWQTADAIVRDIRGWRA